MFSGAARDTDSNNGYGSFPKKAGDLCFVPKNATTVGKQ
jgi:hypothetical protein